MPTAPYIQRPIGQKIAEAIPDATIRESVRVECEYAPWIERSHAWLAPMAAALGLNDAQVDAAFREAATL